MTAEVHQIEDIFGAAPPGKGPACEIWGRYGCRADSHMHLAHIGARRLAESNGRVDRADALSQKGIGGELELLTAPEVGAQDCRPGAQFAYTEANASIAEASSPQ